MDSENMLSITLGKSDGVVSGSIVIPASGMEKINQLVDTIGVELVATHLGLVVLEAIEVTE